MLRSCLDSTDSNRLLYQILPLLCEQNAPISTIFSPQACLGGYLPNSLGGPYHHFNARAPGPCLQSACTCRWRRHRCLRLAANAYDPIRCGPFFPKNPFADPPATRIMQTSSVERPAKIKNRIAPHQKLVGTDGSFYGGSLVSAG